MTPVAIACEAVGHAFRAADGGVRQVLERLDFSVAAGEFVSLLGASGSGKSTALRLIAGLVRPERGTIRVLGQPVQRPRDDVALMFQRASLFPWLTALGNVTFPAAYREGRVTEAQNTRARHLLAMAGLAGREGAQPGELSGGMQQRVSLCRALILAPKVVLLDEPFSALDEQLRESLAVEVSAMIERSGCTAFFVTHSVGEAVLLSDRVFVLAGSPATIVAETSIDLPRPRTLTTLDDERYLHHTRALRQTVRGLLTQETRSSAA